MDFGSWVWLALFLAASILFYAYGRTGRFFRCLFLGAFSGLGALGILWIASHFFKIQIAITPLTVTVASLFGVPGVVGMLILPVI